ncbi:hypothetical protein L596_011303 [Steinernema carpocapsae]|uniref:Uncharacterized protein n=1 Tax=Steinernema carpocapsae TaxID=34508 RepID=A0A4V6A4G1_STECR|nr:hypothetical protein L596_011303 [Steinernema carpocapsae]
MDWLVKETSVVESETLSATTDINYHSQSGATPFSLSNYHFLCSSNTENSCLHHVTTSSFHPYPLGQLTVAPHADSPPIGSSFTNRKFETPKSLNRSIVFQINKTPFFNKRLFGTASIQCHLHPFFPGPSLPPLC